MCRLNVFFAICFSLGPINTIDAQIAYPKITPGPVIDNYHGREILDKYRNIEDIEDTLVQKWFNKQFELTKSILDTIPEIEYFKEEILKLNARTSEFVSRLSTDEQGNLYYMKRAHADRIYRLYMKSDKTGEEKLIFDPSKYSKESSSIYEVNYFRPSWDGSMVLLSISTAGDFTSELVVLDVKQGKLLPEIVTHAAPDLYGGINWLPDNSGFTYLHIPIIDQTIKGYKKSSFSVLYKMGEDPSKTIKIFGDGIGPKMDENFYPITQIQSSKQKFILGYEANSDNFWNCYYATIKSVKSGSPEWKLLLSKERKMLLSEGVFNDSLFYFLSAENASNYKVNQLGVYDNHLGKVVNTVPEMENEVMGEIEIADGNVFISTLQNGVKAKLYEYNIKNKSIKNIDIPKSPGDIEIYNQSTASSNLWIRIEGWATDVTWMKQTESGRFVPMGIVREPEYPELKDVIVRELQIESFDGTYVPVSLIYDKKLKLDGSNRTLINSYGAYGSNMEAFFSPTLLSWVKDGGILAIAHIRGGSEKGEDWHIDGMKSKKPNSWKDIISTTEYLIKNRFTSQEKTTLFSTSAGAIASAMAIIERPALFKAFITRVPLLNPIRYSAGSYKKTSYIEFGSTENENEIDDLIALDPYLNLKEGVAYPSTMIVPSDKDDRIDLWESGKFIAKMQEYNTSSNPIILDININGTHYTSSTDKMARLLGFAKWQTK